MMKERSDLFHLFIWGCKMKGNYKFQRSKGSDLYKVKINWSLQGGRFSVSGDVYLNGKEYSFGQNIDMIKDLFPDDELVSRIHNVWEKWHLNDMQAGSPAQREYLSKFNYQGSDHYNWAKEVLKEAGLDPDPNYIYNGEPYRYGSAWLTEEIPQEIEEEILSWDQLSKKAA